MSKLLIVIPAYNEERTIQTILDKVRSVTLINDVQKEIIVVNDCSKDETEKKVFQPFAEATWIHNQKDFSVEMNEINDKQSGAKDLGEIKLGTEIKLSQNLDIWGNVSHQWGKDKYSDTAVSIGIKYRF